MHEATLLYSLARGYKLKVAKMPMGERDYFYRHAPLAVSNFIVPIIHCTQVSVYLTS